MKSLCLRYSSTSPSCNFNPNRNHLLTTAFDLKALSCAEKKEKRVRKEGVESHLGKRRKLGGCRPIPMADLVGEIGSEERSRNHIDLGLKFDEHLVAFPHWG